MRKPNTRFNVGHQAGWTDKHKPEVALVTLGSNWSRRCDDSRPEGTDESR